MIHSGSMSNLSVFWAVCCICHQRFTSGSLYTSLHSRLNGLTKAFLTRRTHQIKQSFQWNLTAFYANSNNKVGEKCGRVGFEALKYVTWFALMGKKFFFSKKGLNRPSLKGTSSQIPSTTGNFQMVISIKVF